MAAQTATGGGLANGALPSVPQIMPWQRGLREQLVTLARAGKLPHALLLEGSPGSGRNRFAEALARELLCAAPSADGHCDACKSCALCAAGSHADFQHLTPAQAGKAIGIDSVRRAIEFCAETASLGARKVLLVSPVEGLTPAAFNAFLKCLEEPAAGTFMLLVLARGHPLPATVRSRCQRWNLPRPQTSEALAWLEAQLDEPARRQLARQTEAVDSGDPRAGLEQLLRISGEEPLTAQALLGSDEFAALVALDTLRAQAGAGQPPALARVEAAAAALEADRLLDYLEREAARWLKTQSVGGLRSRAGRDMLRALDELRRLRRARQAGSNPNSELLRFRALAACCGLWGRRVRSDVPSE